MIFQLRLLKHSSFINKLIKYLLLLIFIFLFIFIYAYLFKFIFLINKQYYIF